MEVATVARLSALPNIVGIKEASGSVVQMTDIVARTPDDFLLLSGDDPLAVAAMAVGARGLISVASNAVPSEMVQIIELSEKDDYAAARRLHGWLMPFLLVNFIESNPIPIKAAMAAMGLLDETYRLPLVPPGAASRDRIVSVLQDLKLLGSAARP
jgi:4-hydroxy-tetrahydrodipicolinate synthase